VLKTYTACRPFRLPRSLLLPLLQVANSASKCTFGTLKPGQLLDEAVRLAFGVKLQQQRVKFLVLRARECAGFCRWSSELGVLWIRCCVIVQGGVFVIRSRPNILIVELRVVWIRREKVLILAIKPHTGRKGVMVARCKTVW
jgi:hypothetical protein